MESTYEETEWIEMKDDNDDDCFSSNMFANPDPYETFTYHFKLPSNDNNEINNNNEIEIDIQLIGRRADEAQLLSSTGLTLWRAAPILCNYLILNSELYVKNKVVLELGAGLGLCSILTAILGASTVIISDGDSISLSNMRENIERNRHLFSINSNVNVQCLQLRWGINLEEFKIKCNLSTSDGLFDIILGSDIIYVETILEPLFLTIANLLTKNGTFILAYARRNVKIDYVFQTATRYGFQWTEPTTEEGCFIFQRIQ